MIDHPKKAAQLLAALKAAVPFQAELTQRLIKHLKDDQFDLLDQNQQVVSDLSYAGDEGGIVCHMAQSDGTGRALVVSLTQVRVPRTMALAGDISAYQKHRIKKLKKQQPN